MGSDTYGEAAQMSRLSVLSGAPLGIHSQREQLLQAREILELGLDNVSHARQCVALTDGKSIADIGWVKVSISQEIIILNQGSLQDRKFWKRSGISSMKYII